MPSPKKRRNTRTAAWRCTHKVVTFLKNKEDGFFWQMISYFRPLWFARCIFQPNLRETILYRKNPTPRPQEKWGNSRPADV